MNKLDAIDEQILILSYRDRSSHELSESLKKAGFSSKTVSDTIETLTNLGYLNDFNFSQSWALSRASSKLYGSRKIRQELYEKGIPEDIINDTLSNASLSETERDRALKLANKKLSSIKNLDNKTAYRRLAQYLFRRGFSSEIVCSVCREVFETLDTDL
ncbi:MAG: regulatory protein RecX [Rubrobacteridae bacterium]|nr:regulatory protein RecX [Rubrobacteridae bacterium]